MSLDRCTHKAESLNQGSLFMQVLKMTGAAIAILSNSAPRS